MTKQLANEFARWLERHGAILKPTTNQWEVVRWSPANGTTTHVMYLKKTGLESFSSDGARQIWVQFLEDVPAPGTLLTVTDEADSPNLGWSQGGLAPDLTIFAGVRPIVRPALLAPAATELHVEPPRQVHYSTGADVHDEKGRWVATIHGTAGAQYNPIDSFVANCYLIGAAPQMLAALQVAWQHLMPDDSPSLDDAINQIEKAIELATKGPK